MNKFLDDNFLLENETAEKLYHEHAKNMPIIDYHCHLSPAEIAEDKIFQNITRIWLNGDHYKWRAMRANGIPEQYITGDASDPEKFMKWAETVPNTLRNPLYHWTHLELTRYFGIQKLLNPDTAATIYEETSEKLTSAEYSVRNLLRKMKVEVVCTTDDPVDSLEFHQKILKDGYEIKVLPAWRPDKAMAVENPVFYNKYLDQLASVSDTEINTFLALLEALQKRHEFFHQQGCRLSDHGMETFYAKPYLDNEIAIIFRRIRSGNFLTLDEIEKFKSAMLVIFGEMDYASNWTQQFHIGALRNNNSRMFKILGPDAGFDSIGDFEIARPMSRFLDRLEENGKLTKTIVYNLNPRDNELLISMIYNFNDGAVPGKMQLGSGWWFLDQKDGIKRQLNALSNMGLLSRFVGMLTDSRSFLSYPRHEYFRRILCNLIGKDMENGKLPDEPELLGQMVENICYKNAREYFGFYDFK
jgi:glucuronate isomerase